LGNLDLQGGQGHTPDQGQCLDGSKVTAVAAVEGSLLEVSLVDAESVRDKPLIRMSLTKQSYGDTEFEVLDTNGYILVFGG
jgi:hypothetical protein